MRFTIKREEFLKGLLIASRAVANKVVVPVLAFLKLELNEMGLFITGSNYDLTIRTFIPYKDGEVEIIRNYKEGTTLIDHQTLIGIIKLKDDEEITVDVIDSTIAYINGKKGNYQLHCTPEEYPDLDLEASGTKLTLDKEQFDTIVSQTSFAASTKEQNPMLTAMNLAASDGLLAVTTLDSARLARKEIIIDKGIEFTANVPAKMMVEIDRLLDGVDRLEIAFTDKKALFTLGRTIIATRLIAGPYPKTKNILSRIPNTSLETNAADLMKAIEIIGSLSEERVKVVDLKVDETSLEISARSQNASGVERIDVFKYDGEPFRISFNSEFVLAAVRALASQDVMFQFFTNSEAFFIKNPNDDSVVQIVTPVRPKF